MRKCLTAWLCLLLLTGCSRVEGNQTPMLPPMPDKIGAYEDGVPILDVYVTEEESVRALPLEEYLCGVLAGEMKNDWPLEALRAQAILARTFVLKFMTEKESKYGGADVSTDVEEAQAYDAAAVNDRVREAVSSTRGMVLSANGELPYAWFHANAGGRTARAREGLHWKDAELPYTVSVESPEEDPMPWTAAFSAREVRKAAEQCGVVLGEALESAEIGETGESGRALTLILNGEAVNAADFRVAIGSMEMRSTLLTELSLADSMLLLSGKGYGHGVGMSQWGARAMASEGKTAEDIIARYFQGVEIVRMY